MTHLKIQQNTTGIEEVSHSIIEKLYNLAISGDLDVSSNLLGRLHTSATYRSYVDYLTTNYPNLYITSSDYYVKFADPEVRRIFALSNYGDGFGLLLSTAQTITDLNNVTISGTGYQFLNNTTLLSFDELLYFTGLIRIPINAFKGCTNLSQVTLPVSTTTIGEDAFNGVPFSSINLSNITTIENRGFAVTGNSTSGFEVNAPNLTTFSGAGLFIWANVTRVLNLGSVTSIPDSCFDTCPKLTSVVLPTTCTLIGNDAFLQCSNLTSVTGSSNVANIGASAFNGCTNLTDVTLPNTVTTFNASCFKDCSNLENITIPNSIILNGNEQFYGCSKISFPSQLTVSVANGRGDTSFGNCTGLQEVIFDSSVQTIGKWMFGSSGVTKVSGSGVKYLTEGSFSNCTNLLEVNLPSAEGIQDSWDAGYNYVFGGCTNLKKVVLGKLKTFPNNTTYGILDRAWFSNCSSLETIDIGDAITQFNVEGDKWHVEFHGAQNVRNFIIRATTVPTMNINTSGATVPIEAFGGSNVKIYVPDAAVNDYKLAAGWSDVASYIYPLSQYNAS